MICEQVMIRGRDDLLEDTENLVFYTGKLTKLYTNET